MIPITYSLKSASADKDDYYLKISKLTDEILFHADSTLMPFVDEYTEFLKSYDLEDIRHKEEYVLELISFGVLWKSYAETALSTRMAPFVTLSHLAEWRKTHQRLKPYIDFARGILTTLFLLPSKKHISGYISLEQIDHVCKWFDATGEYKEEAIRFIRWRAWWQTLAPEKLKEMLTVIYNFSGLFIKLSDKVLSPYLPNVDSFVQNKARFYRWREDRISCMRGKSDYYLNMTGAVLMNRAFREDFEKTGIRVLLLPGCMRIKPAEECKAVRVRGGLSCISCNKECRVSQLKEIGKKNKFEVCIIPHASDLSLWSPQKGMQNCGVIASACLTHLIEGGLELKRYDVPAQCVPLDYCGCKKHWDRKGFPTEFNISELNRILS